MRTTISANIKTIADPIDPNLGTNKILVAIPTAAAKDEFHIWKFFFKICNRVICRIVIYEYNFKIYSMDMLVNAVNALSCHFGSIEIYYDD